MRSQSETCKYRWSSENRLLQPFGVGTAVIVTGVGVIGLEGHPGIDIQEFNVSTADWDLPGGV